jgi:membrane peptidoglycan carboxypeptidase
MLRVGDLTPAQAADVGNEPLVLHPQPQDQVLEAPHFVFYVIDYLTKKYGADLLNSGLKVTTTLDIDLQNKAEAIVRNDVGTFAGLGINNGAMTALNPNTGEILTYVGSADYYNKAIGGSVDYVNPPCDNERRQCGRQPGSSFKPYVYATALANGLQPNSIVDDHQQDFGGFFIHNFDNASRGRMTVRQALVQSRNIPPVLLLRDLGYGRVFQTTRALGITTYLKPELGTAIGSSEVMMLEHASAYGVFATQGTYRPANPILKIEDADGQLLKDPGKPVLSPAVAYVLNDILNGYAKEYNLGLMGPAAGKSGTTNKGVDLWYMGYTPDLVVASWMAHTGPCANGQLGLCPLGDNIYGVNTASRVFKDFLPVYYGNRKIPEFVKPPGVSGGSFCRTIQTPGQEGEPPTSRQFCGRGDVQVEGTAFFKGGY